MEEIIVTVIIMLFGAGIPAFVAHKLELNAIIIGILYIGLTYWVIPDFTFFSIVVYLGVLILMGAIGSVRVENEKVANMTQEERKAYNSEKQKELAEVQRVQAEKNIVRCPNCQSIDVNFIGNQRKGFSIGKAVGGTLLTGGIGSLAGFAGKKGKKDNWHCNDCGYTFERKRK